mgnify:CR=1 FL=1
MVQRTYNRFDLWVKQDNTAIFSGSPSFIDAKNLDWLKDWQGVTLWPKINKLFTSNVALRGIDAEQLWTPDNARTIVWWDNGEIYKFNSTDNTPEYTIAWQNIVQIASLGNDYIIFTKANFSSATINIYKISKSDVQSWIWTSLASALLPSALSHVWVPPVLAVWSELFIWGNGTVRKFDWSTITATETFPDDYVTWLTLQGSTIAVYTRTWNVYFWDWWATVESARGKTWARTEKAVNLNGRDFITSEDWQLKQGSYTQFWKIFNSKNSFRLEDKSQIQNKLDFSSNDDNLNHTAITALDDVYFFWNDSIKWIYKYWSLIAWTWKGIHKIITQNNAGTQIDFIYDMYFYERTDRRLYFSYKAWSTFWVDYIDLDDLESCNTWYGVTEILTWWTAFKKKLNVARISVSNVDANKTASLYYRVNNQDWVLLRTINSTTEDIYYRENITKEADWSPFKQFIDIQFKIELNSTTNDNKPPMLNELLLDYTIIEA